MTQSAALSSGAAPEYRDLLMPLLGDRDPLAVQAETEAALRTATAGISADKLRQPEKPGKWSILEVVQHLADAELVLGVRMRMIAAEPMPPIAAFDQDLWAKELRYNATSLDDALDQFGAIRRINLRLIHSLTPEQRERKGIHSQRGPESINTILRLYAAHDLYHLSQIERIKKSVGAA